MLSEEDMKEIEKAKSNILRGNDIESASLILEKVIWDNLIIVSGRVDITKVAVRQILNFIEEYKDKGYLDVVKEKVKANEEIAKLQKENNRLKKYDYRNIKIDEQNKISSPSFTQEQLDLMNLGIALYVGIPKLLEDESEDNNIWMKKKRMLSKD